MNAKTKHTKLTKPTVTKVAPAKKPVIKKDRYFEASGGRKTAVSRARVWPTNSGGLTILINDRDYKEYFPIARNQSAVVEPFKAINLLDANFKVTVHVYGGGPTGQAEATRHALAQALSKVNKSHRQPLKALGFLTRDARAVERKKYGLKKARKAPQWAKR